MSLSQPKQPSSPKRQPLDDALKNNINLQIPQLLSNLFSSQNKTLLDHALNNLQTHFSNIINLRLPDPFSLPKNPSSILDNLFFKKNLSLSEAEIKKRMAGIRVYTISNHSEDSCIAVSDHEARSVEFFFLSKSDAEKYAEGYMQLNGSRLGDLYALEVPLSEVIDYEGVGSPIRLVPDLSQVKNATEERRKNIADSPDDDDVRFSGVPVFQTDRLSFELSYKAGKKYRPVFLRKEDLERTLTRMEVLESTKIERSDIQAVALEDIIQAMKDCSTSQWNDVVFIAPGLTFSTWCRWKHKL